MYMGDLFITCFSPKRPSSGNTYIKITKKSYWVMSGLYINELFSIINWLILKGNWDAHRSHFHSISPALHYTVHLESSVYSQISQLIRFFTSKTIIHKSNRVQTSPTSPKICSLLQNLYSR